VRRDLSAAELHARIAQTFRVAAELSASRVSVEIHGSVATLTGRVRSTEERRAAEQAALSTPGISVVDDRLQVQT
jgi:osmotically-inducible protein OsmY